MWSWARRWWRGCPASWLRRRLPCLRCPLPGVVGRECVSSGQPGGPNPRPLNPHGWSQASPLKFQIELAANICSGSRLGTPEPREVELLPPDTQQRAGGGVTYLSSRRSVCSLARPSAETETETRGGVRLPLGSPLSPGVLPAPSPWVLTEWFQNFIAPASQATSPLPSPGAWLREGGRGGQLRALGSALGDPGDGHPFPRGSASGGCVGLTGSLAWSS